MLCVFCWRKIEWHHADITLRLTGAEHDMGRLVSLYSYLCLVYRFLRSRVWCPRQLMCSVLLEEQLGSRLQPERNGAL